MIERKSLKDHPAHGHADPDRFFDMQRIG
jgi:hypothetical protein